MVVRLFHFVGARVHLNQNGFANAAGAVGHGAVQSQVVEENDVPGFDFQNGGVFDGVFFTQAFLQVLAALDSAQFVGAGVDAQTAHLVGGIGDENDTRHHGVVDGGKVGVVLVHGEWGAVLGGFLEEFGVVKDDVRADEGFCLVEKTAMLESLQPDR